LTNLADKLPTGLRNRRFHQLLPSGFSSVALPNFGSTTENSANFASSITFAAPVALKRISTMLRAFLFAYQRFKNRDLPIKP
jgi:hypothetical protein